MGLSATYHLWERGQLFFVMQRRESDVFEDTTAQLNLNIALDRDSITLSARSVDLDGDKHNGFAFDARRSRPPDTGFGYSVNVQREGDFDSGYGQLEYQATHARFLVEAEKFDNVDSRLRGTASGALVAVGGRMFATPPLDTGFALVRVPGVAGVPILRENQVVGHTDANGDLLVRELLPFHANKLALDPAAVPAGYDLQVPVRNVQVSRNTGTVVVLDTIAVRAVTGHFRYSGAQSGDLVRVGNATEPALVGSEGLFYLEGLAAGTQVATIERENGAVRCTLVVPAGGTGTVTNLGDVTCEDAAQ
jgi:outer membrane usher protein